MRTDSEIKKDVENELRWDPDIDATDIGVSVHNGVVTLTGFVRSYMQKTQAERDAKRVAGVVAVANDVEVRLPYINKRPDPEIARDAVQKLQNELPYSSQFIKVTVKDGWLTLEGIISVTGRKRPCVRCEASSELRTTSRSNRGWRRARSSKRSKRR
jgi:osmotically-inducible protein OsmY